jgi:hypothetical protein
LARLERSIRRRLDARAALDSDPLFDGRFDDAKASSAEAAQRAPANQRARFEQQASNLTATIADRATYEEPMRPPEGIRAVFVNGQLAVDRGQVTGVRAGAVLRHRRRS